ncbi:unnamed protein product [Amaranthus hypochondriacus]
MAIHDNNSSSETTQNSEFTHNPGSIYYLHPTDQANNKLVSIPFNGENFEKWKRSMLITLIAKNKVGFIDGTLPTPLPTSSDYKAWERCNNMVIGWILSSLDDSISSSVFYHKIASEIWKELEERFGQPSFAHLYSLQEKLSKIEHQAGMSIADFFTQIKGIWDEMDNVISLPTCTCCNKCVLNKQILEMQSAQRILHFLMKIDSRFEHVRSNILMMDKLPSISQVYRILQQEETHKMMNKQCSTPMVEPAAFISTKRQSQENSNGQFAKGIDPQRKIHSSNGKKSYFCDHCKIPGHTISRCYKIHGYPPPSKAKRVAAVVNSDEDFIHQSGLSEDQFTRLMNFIGKQQNEGCANNDSHHAEFASHSTMTGPFNEETYASW